MITGSNVNRPVPDRWLVVLDAVADLCIAQRSDGVPTDLVSRRLRATNRSATARTVLRALRRQGYLYSPAESVEGAPRRWALTPAGRSVTRALGSAVGASENTTTTRSIASNRRVPTGADVASVSSRTPSVA